MEKQVIIDFEQPIVDKFMAFLKSKQDAIEIHNKYKAINTKEGCYGTRSAQHNSAGQLEFEGKKFGYLSIQVYTYPNFVHKHGEMPTIVELHLRSEDHNTQLGCFYLNWETFAKHVQPLIKTSKS